MTMQKPCILGPAPNTSEISTPIIQCHFYYAFTKDQNEWTLVGLLDYMPWFYWLSTTEYFHFHHFFHLHLCIHICISWAVKEIYNYWTSLAIAVTCSFPSFLYRIGLLFLKESSFPHTSWTHVSFLSEETLNDLDTLLNWGSRLFIQPVMWVRSTIRFPGVNKKT